MKTDRSRFTSSASRLFAVAVLACAGAVVGPAGAEEVTGKPFDHVGTRFILTGSHEGVACESCHARGVFRGTPTQCSFCHDGSGMRAESGKPLDHLPTSNQCDDCHTTMTWYEVRFEHSSVQGACSSCHNDMTAAGKPPGHVVTSLECDSCHNTFGWSGTRFDHAGITSNCASCHNGIDATGLPTSGHFMTAQDCSLCHRNTAWRPDIFRHMSANYPGDHARNLDCTECHPGNSDPVVYTDDPSLAPDCAGCHRNDYRSGPHRKYENPDTNYTVQELADCSGSCHIYTDSSLTTIKDRRNGHHRVRDRDFDD